MLTDLMPSLISAAIRACALGLVSSASLFVFRVRCSATRHATWTVVLVGMLLQIPLGQFAPAVPLKALPALAAHIQEKVTKASRPSASATQTLPSTSPTRRGLQSKWSPSASSGAILTVAYFTVLALLFVRMAFGFWKLNGILRGAKPLPDLGPNVVETDLLPAPGSVGCFRPRIVLPEAWRDWNTVKLRAVLAHERAHIQRRDWLIRIASRMNVCVFWFHPLAWWLECELARLAEEVCDDAAVSETDDREGYAAALVDIALAAAAHRRVSNWGFIAMARQPNVAQRVNRILNPNLEVPKPFGRLAWATLLACSLPVIYLSSTVKMGSENRDSRVLAPSGLRSSDEARIVDIRVHGNQSVPRDVILAHVRAHLGDIFDQASIERDFNSLWNTGFFEDLRLERAATPKGWILHIYVKERPSLKEVTPHVAGQRSPKRRILQTAPDPDLRPATLLRPGEDPPSIAMCILIDSSGSMDNKRDEMKAAALALVKASKPHDQVCIVGFDDEVFNGLPHGEDFTSDIEEMEEALAHIGSRGGTAMRDAVWTSTGQIAANAHNGRKVLVLITDGSDTSSKVTQEELLRQVKQSGVRIYSIGLLMGDPRPAEAARAALAQLAEASGGLDFYPRDLAEVESTSHEIANEARK
jgi:Mg-chelatase subunit ChlD